MKKFFLIVSLLAAPLAFADSVTVFNFNQNLGNIGKSDGFTQGLFSFFLTGYNSPGVQSNMWEKNESPTETGIGLANEEDHEIAGQEFVQFDASKLLALKAPPTFIIISINSVQDSETYNVYGSNVAGQRGTLLAANQTGNDFSLPNLGTFAFYSIGGGRGNITVDDVHVITRTSEASTGLLFVVAALFSFLCTKLVRKWNA